MSDRKKRATETALQTVAEIARTLAAAPTLEETLQRIVDLGVEYIHGCESASISIIHGFERSTLVWSNPAALLVEQAQYRHDQGPCLESLTAHETIVIEDIDEEQRWPQWREAVREFDLRSSISFRLFIVSGDEETFGSLSMFASRAHAFDDHAQALGQVFASHAAVALKAAITEAGLEQAVRSRDAIGQAKGVLMERHDVDADEAFEMLCRMSNDRDIEMRALAEQVAELGGLPK